MKEKGITEKQKKTLSIIAFLLFLAFCGVVGWFIGKPMLEFFDDPQKFKAWVDEKGILGRIAFIGMVFFQVVIALVPGEPLEMGAGYAFGAIEGTILCMLGITLGSMVVFLLVRKLGVRFVEVFFSREKINSLKFLKNKKRRAVITFLVFFLPGTPKDLLTYFVGLTDIKMSHFILLASIARLPSIITSTIGGGALGDKEYITAGIVFAATLFFSLGGLLIYNHLQKRKEKKKENE